ncbi:hypothetical protein ACHQM5_007416 [Ranunculus cassubicifolius]
MSLPPSQPSSLSTKPTPPRRVPPPCWTHEETLALIESYHEKWYILRRGNLKASHWQEVADNVARRCRFAIPTKTSVQCRHKIEKLRKRYRTEKQRAANDPNRFVTSWNFFKKMDDMEKGPLMAATTTTGDSDDNPDEDPDEDDDDLEEESQPIGCNMNQTHQNQISSPVAAAVNYHRLISNGSGSGSPGGGGYRFRIPSGGSRSVPSPLGRFDGNPNFNPNPNHSPNSTPNNTRFMNSSYSTPKPSYGRSDESGSRSKSKRELDPMGEMVSSIRMLGEGFVKMEQKKIEMAKEMEQMRMEMEMKRTEMILESQQKIVEAFAKGISASKKMKRMPSPE